MKVGLIGATNVGKSTLFNKLIGNHRAIVTDVHGTTRDILYEVVEWGEEGRVNQAKWDLKWDDKRKGVTKNNEKGDIKDDQGEADVEDQTWELTFLDTPGLDTFDEEIPYIKQVIDASDLIFFVIDAGVGFGAKEQDIYDLVSQAHKKSQTVLVINKLEKAFSRGEEDLALAEYWGMGCSDVFGVSAKADRGLRLLKKKIRDVKLERNDNDSVAQTDLDEMQSVDESEVEDDVIPIAILGKPNAGKSTLLNQLLGEDRALVSDVPGTTLDYNVGNFTFDGQEYRLYDTAGIKRKGKIVGLEKIAYKKTVGMLQFVRPLVVLVIDLDAGITHRDMSLLGEMMQMKLPVIVCGNKVDLFSKNIKKEKMSQLVAYVDFAKYIPVLPLSAKTGEGVKKLFQTVMGVWFEFAKRIPTAELNALVSREILNRPPRFSKNKICKIRYISQVESKPPTFVASVNNKEFANFAFKRRLDNTIRLNYGFVGVPLRIKWKGEKKDNPYVDEK